MADGAEIRFDEPAIDRAADKLVREYLSAGTRAVAGVTKRLERRLEAATQAAVPGRLWRAWASETFPKSGPARDPVGSVFVKGGARSQGAIAFWTRQGEIRGKSGQYLAIPLPAAGARGRARDLSPGEWERRTGIRLRFLWRQGKPSLLVAPGGTTNARTGAFRPLTRGRRAAGRGGTNPLADAVVPIFVLLPVVRFRNAFAIQPIIDAAQADLPGAFLNEVAAIG